MKPMIVLQTDFSLTWSAVNQMKGVIKIVDRELEIHDLCHDIKSFDPWEASLSLNTAESYWPKGTIFVSVVDPGVGTDRKACVAKLKDGNYIVTPDNGTLTHLYHRIGIESVREIDESTNRYQSNETVSVFHGRDIFGYTAARLASGCITFEEVGKEYPISDIVICDEYAMHSTWLEDCVNSWILTGNVHYGGILFNITNDEWNQRFQLGEQFEVCITYDEKVYFQDTVLFGKSFGDVEIGKPILYNGSSLYLALDLNCDHFMNQYHIGMGKDWKVTIQKVNL